MILFIYKYGQYNFINVEIIVKNQINNNIMIHVRDRRTPFYIAQVVQIIEK